MNPEGALQRGRNRIAARCRAGGEQADHPISVVAGSWIRRQCSFFGSAGRHPGRIRTQYAQKRAAIMERYAKWRRKRTQEQTGRSREPPTKLFVKRKRRSRNRPSPVVASVPVAPRGGSRNNPDDSSSTPLAASLASNRRPHSRTILRPVLLIAAQTKTKRSLSHISGPAKVKLPTTRMAQNF